VGRIESGVRVNASLKKNHRLRGVMGRLGRKMCLCDQNSDIFEVQMNLYGFCAVISWSRCLVQIR